MSESREYYSRSEEFGDVYISEEVLETIAGEADDPLYLHE